MFLVYHDGLVRYVNVKERKITEFYAHDEYIDSYTYRKYHGKHRDVPYDFNRILGNRTDPFKKVIGCVTLETLERTLDLIGSYSDSHAWAAIRAEMIKVLV